MLINFKQKNSRTIASIRDSYAALCWNLDFHIEEIEMI